MNKVDDFIELRQKVDVWTNCVIEQIKRIRDDCKRIDESENLSLSSKCFLTRLWVNLSHFGHTLYKTYLRI